MIGVGLRDPRHAGRCLVSVADLAPDRQGTSRIEAEAIVAAMADHARNWPDLSPGVVAFSKAQPNTLTEVLERARRRDPVLDAFLRDGKSEDLFVKNIENVQGDEHDVFLISVGCGPQEPNGRLPSMSFGPVNAEDDAGVTFAPAHDAATMRATMRHPDDTTDPLLTP